MPQLNEESRLKKSNSPHSEALKGPEAGSNAGRGFRYQDMIGALFVTQMHLGEERFDAIIPEGSDDYEICVAEGIILIDTKSNRAESRLRKESEDETSIKGLWARPLRPGTTVSEYWLVTQMSRNGSAREKSAVKSTLQDPAGKSNRSFILNEPDPLQAATDLLVNRRKLTPLAATLIVINFAHFVGELASANGPRALQDRKAITPSEAERIAARVLAAVDSNRLEVLLRSGFLSTIDFLTPIEDAGFYLGVDVQPGHFASGLALERPREAARVVEAINRIGVVVIKGPSGAGKSSLMWNAVQSARDARRWFRVNPAVSTEASALTAFFHAYEDIAVGFVIDDVGRGGIEALSILRAYCQSHKKAVIIGSIRSEDAALLPARHKIAEIDALADAEIAAELWRRLQKRNQTQWPGWSEPWAQSNGLLLEYSHILTLGGRLGAVIQDQIRVRLEERRDHELAILCNVALAASHGGSIQIATLRDKLGLSQGTLARAMQRLIAEHLVRLDDSGKRFSGLHSLRAASISSALFEIGYASLSEQAIQAIAVAEVATLEKVISGLVAASTISDEAAAQAIAARFAGKSDLSGISTAIRGLRAGGISTIARNWIATLPTAAIPRKLATAAALMGLSTPAAMADVGDFRKLAAVGSRLHDAIATKRIPPSLTVALIAALKESAPHAQIGDVIESLSALARARLTSEQRKEISELPLALDRFSISEVVRAFDAGESIDPKITTDWAARVGEMNLLNRLSSETPFALPITTEETEEGLVVHADIYEAAAQAGESPNDLLVSHVDAIMRLEPRAARANVRLISKEREVSLHIDSEKRMPRENAPPKTVAQFNRSVLDAVAVAVSSESWSHYLVAGEDLLKRGLQALQRLLDSLLVGRRNTQAIHALNAVVSACDDLIAPSEPPPGNLTEVSVLTGRHLTPLQNIVFKCNGQFVIRVAKLPERAAALAIYCDDLCKTAESAKQEPWLLVRSGPPKQLDELLSVLHKIKLMALEAAASGLSPIQRWPKADRKPKDAFDLIARRSQKAFTDRVNARHASLIDLVRNELPSAQLLGPTPVDGIMWQREFAVTFVAPTLECFKKWFLEARFIGQRLRDQLGDNADLAIIPFVNGSAAVEYTYQLSRGDNDSLAAKTLIAAGQISLLSPPVQSIIDRIAAPVIRHPLEIKRFFSALQNFIGMQALGLGISGRPPAERERFNHGVQDLVELGPCMNIFFKHIEHPAVAKLNRLVRYLISDFDIAINMPTLSSDEFQDALLELTWSRSQRLS